MSFVSTLKPFVDEKVEACSFRLAALDLILILK